MLLVSGALPSRAQTTSVIHSFTGTTTDGDTPTSLIQAQDGNYYGTTAYGGSAGSCTDADGQSVGCGTIFKMVLSGSTATVTVLYSFSGGTDGGYPTGLIQGPDGNLYGTTAFGGSSGSIGATTGNGNCLAGDGTETGCGTIFEISPSSPPAAGKLVPIYNFDGSSNGAYPNPLTLGAGGVFYGSALACSQCSSGGAYGVLFDFTPAGATAVTPTPLSTFGINKGQNGSSFAYPNSLIQANAQTLYGVAQLGGDTTIDSTGCLFVGANTFGCGGVFSYNLSTAKESDVCIFNKSANVATSSSNFSRSLLPAGSELVIKPDTIVKQSSGRFPSDGQPWSFQSAPMAIALGGDGNIYGTVPPACISGESSSSVSYTASAACTGATTYDAVAPAAVFQCIPSTSSAATLNTIYAFGATNNGGSVVDGGGSLQGLILASDGNYYGTSGVYTFDLTPTQMATFTSAGTTSPLTSLSPFYSTLASDTTNFSPNSMIQGSDGDFYGISATGGTTATSHLPGDGAAFQVSTSLKPPVQLSFTQSTVTLGGSSTLNWTVPGAYSLTAQQCYAYVQNNAAGAGTWSKLQPGSLSNGAYSGSLTITPTAPGSYTYALTCGGIVSGFATLKVNASALTISPNALPAGTAKTPYSEMLTPGGGSGTGYQFSITAGATNLTALGLSLSSAGVISGTPTAGSATFTVQLTDSLSDITSQAYTLTVNKATPTVSVWPSAGAITYGQTLASSSLTGGTASVAGMFAWTTPTTAPGAGTASEGVTFTPTDTTNYNSVTGTVMVTVNKATPSVTAWPMASAITVGQTLGSSTLSGGSASVAGMFAWTTPSTAPALGTDTESVTFTPLDSTDYNPVNGTVSVTVNAAAGFTLSPSPMSVSVAQGSSGTSTITVTDLGGFSGNVTLATVGLPSGVTSSFAAGTAPGTQVLTLQATTSAVVTTAPVTVTITGTSGALSAMTTISLSITAQPSFTPGSGGTTSISISPGATTGNTGTISVVGTNGFAGTVNLTCKVTTSMTNVSDMPSCSLNPPSVTLSGTAAQTSTLTVTTTAASSAQNSTKKLFWPTSGTTLALVMLLVVPRKRRSWLAMMGIVLLFALVGAVGCGGGGRGGGGGGGGGNPGTTAGTYTITVTGTSGSVTATVGTVTITVL